MSNQKLSLQKEIDVKKNILYKTKDIDSLITDQGFRLNIPKAENNSTANQKKSTE